MSMRVRAALRVHSQTVNRTAIDTLVVLAIAGSRPRDPAHGASPGPIARAFGYAASAHSFHVPEPSSTPVGLPPES